MKYINIYRTIGLYLIFASAQAYGQSLPDDSFSYEIAAINGSGCPAGTVSIGVSGYHQDLYISFSEFKGYAGPDLPISLGRRNCQVSFDLNVPQGYQAALESYDVTGWMDLEENTYNILSSRTYFQGESQSSYSRINIQGESSFGFAYRITVPEDSLIWSSCNAERSLNVNLASFVRSDRSSDDPGYGEYEIERLSNFSYVLRSC